MDYPKYSLHLFAGAGGGLLADIIDGIRPICAVEIEKHPQRVLAKRFPNLAIWDDVCTFRADNPECADAFADLRAVADELVIAGGFPCQDISCAGRGAGLRGERSGLWREYARIVREIRPAYVFVENSPCLFSGDLATFSKTWPRFGMMRHGVSYRLPIWEPCTSASGFGSQPNAWPTPTVHGNNNFKGASAKSGDGLMTVIKRREGWPTPCASGDLHYRLRGGSQASKSLAVAVYPTPCAHDAMAQSGKPHGWQRNGKELQRNLNDLVVRMAYPTPTAKDANGPWHTTHSPSLNVVVTTYPTPRALSLCGGSGSYQQIKNNPNLTDDEKRALIASAGRGANKYNTPTVHGDGGSGRNGAMPKYGQLNPDWEEWLMAWPVGWTDIETPNIRLVWLDPSIDPADYGEIPRVTNRRDNRPARVKEIGNGQFPLTAAAAFHWGLYVLEIVP